MGGLDLKACGIWACDTANTNSWEIAATTMLCRSTADAILLKESKVFEQKVHGKQHDARNLG